MTPIPRIRVWAPKATSVEIVIGGGTDADAGADAGRGPDRRAIQSTLGGWWTGSWPDVVAGTDYRFSMDGGPPMPDPRSAWQPAGIHGPSRIVDDEAFAWTDAQWRPGPLGDAIIYELHTWSS